jgi:glycosyltransferase involved in cell wall biosynthesis
MCSLEERPEPSDPNSSSPSGPRIEAEANAPLVSIIIPVYNVGPYLRQCLESVITQSLAEIEIICVNDASTDDSLSVLQEFAAKDPRIRILDKQKNEGLSVARNVGMDAARTKYLLFVDADDFVHPELCSKALHCAETTQSDLVLFGYTVVSDGRTPHAGSNFTETLGRTHPRDVPALLGLASFAWTKFIRTQKAREIGMRFPDGLYFEDTPVHWMLVTLIDSIALLPVGLYYYRQRTGSISRRTDWTLTHRAVVCNHIREMLAKHGLFDKYADLFLEMELKVYCSIYDNIAPEHKNGFWEIFDKRRREDDWRRIIDRKSLDWRARDLYYSAEGAILPRARRALWLILRWCYRAVKKGWNASSLGSGVICE